MTFEEWFNEQEGAGTRRDRFIDDVVLRHPFLGRGEDWLHAAYNAGVKEGRSTLSGSKGSPTPPYIKYPTPSYPNPVPPPFTPNPWPDVRNCSKCGISLEGVMGYVCTDQTCPTFKHTWSGTITAGGGSTGAMGGFSNVNGFADAGSVTTDGYRYDGDIKR